MRLRTFKQGDDVTMLIEFPDDRDGDTDAAKQQVQQILNLDPSLDTYQIVFSPTQKIDGVLAIHTRSIIEMLIELSAYVERPESHVAQGYIDNIADDDDPTTFPQIRIRYTLCRVCSESLIH